MSVRFQADADLNHIIVKATLRREPSIDFQTAHATGLVGVPDPEVLALTAGCDRLCSKVSCRQRQLDHLERFARFDQRAIRV
jgi:hypothetical protein